MHAGWKVFGIAAVVFGIALGAERLLLPDAVPVGLAQAAQPSSAVMTAFALRAVELIAAWVALVALGVMLAAWAKEKWRRTVV